MLELRGLSKTFDPGTVMAKQVFDGLNLSVPRGQFVTIIGSNGAGKSTLFGAIGGSFLPDSGAVLIDGVDVTFWPAHRRAKWVGRLFQDPLMGTAPNMTLAENLSLVYLRNHPEASFWGITKKGKALLRDRVAMLGLGLERRLDDRVGSLSGGQRQALTLLMATLVPPKVLLLDEHTAALDPATAEVVSRLTADIVAREGLTCLMVTHNIAQALALGDRTLMMAGGKVMFDLSGQERASATPQSLLERFKDAVAASDRMVFSA